MGFDVITYYPVTDVTNGSAATVPYPAGKSKGLYSENNAQHVVISGQNTYTAPKDFTLTFNAVASGITLTPVSGVTFYAGAAITLQVERRGPDTNWLPPANNQNQMLQPMYPMVIDFGSPLTISATGICSTTALGTNTAIGVGTATALDSSVLPIASGVVTLDVPRNITITSSGNASGSTYTIKGFDQYGVALTENITGPNATTVQGKKAFKKVTNISVTAGVSGTSVGFGKILGFPFLVGSTQQVMKEVQDGAAATAGTVTIGILTAATATTGDVRGTYTPNATLDGTIGLALYVLTPDFSEKGVAQYGA